MSRLDPYKPHEEDVSFECPCGGLVVAKFVLPTQDGFYAVIGGCTKCVAQGDSKTSVAFLQVKGKAETSRFNRFRDLSPVVYQKRRSA
jgi:hypothetical protein